LGHEHKEDGERRDSGICRHIRSRINTTTEIKFSEEWGSGDEIGALNRLGPDKVRDALDTVKHLKTYQLGYVVSSATPAFGTRVFRHYVWDTALQGENMLTYYDDIAYPGYLGVGSQIDTLAHICTDQLCYNRIPKDKMFNPTDTAEDILGMTDGTRLSSNGVKHLGAENLPPIVTRGIVLDMPKVFDKDRLEPGDDITCEKLVAALKRQKTEIKPGDVVLLHTGYSQIMDDPQYPQTYPGLSLSGAQFLIEKEVIAVGADTVAVEAFPSEENEAIWPGSLFAVHTLLIPKNGITILEVMRTEELVNDGITEFMIVLGAVRVQGAAQSYVNPVAII
jgi:kynurenine formamidase